MSNWTPAQAAPNLTGYGHPAGSTYGTTVNAHPASANMFGSWAELVASTGVQAGAMMVFAMDSSTGTRYAVHIGIGASGSEKVLVEKLMFQQPRASQGSDCYFIPIMVPTGKRLAARCSANAGGSNLDVYVVLIPLSVSPLARFGRTAAYGYGSGESSLGTSIDPGTTVNTKGAYAELVASTTNPIKFILLMLGLQANAIASDAKWRLDLAVGASGLEQIILPDVVFESATANDDMLTKVLALPCCIKAGSRLAARAQCTVNDSFDRFFDVAILGVD